MTLTYPIYASIIWYALRDQDPLLGHSLFRSLNWIDMGIRGSLLIDGAYSPLRLKWVFDSEPHTIGRIKVSAAFWPADHAVVIITLAHLTVLARTEGAFIRLTYAMLPKAHHISISPRIGRCWIGSRGVLLESIRLSAPQSTMRTLKCEPKLFSRTLKTWKKRGLHRIAVGCHKAEGW